MASNVQVTGSVGKVAGLNVGKAGAEINLGTKEIGTVSLNGVKPGDPNKETKGVEARYGLGKLSYEKETTTQQTATGPQETTQEKTSLTFAGLGGKVEQTNGGPMTASFAGEDSAVATVAKGVVNDVKVSVALFVKIEVKYDGPAIPDR